MDNGKADWKSLQSALESITWDDLFIDLDANDVVARLTKAVLELSHKYVLVKVIHQKPYRHPWIDDKCREYLCRKHAATDASDYCTARDECTLVFAAAYCAFVRSTRQTMLKVDAKDRSKYSKDLLAHSIAKENVLALKGSDGWAKQLVGFNILRQRLSSYLMHE